MPLKLGVCTYPYLWEFPLDQALERIKELGFTGFELMSTPPHAFPYELGRKERKDLANLIDSLGLSLISLNPTFGDLNIASPRETFRKKSIKEIKEQIILAKDLNAEIVIVNPGRRPVFGAPPLRKTWEWSKRGIIECCKHAEEEGIIIGLEHTAYRFMEKAEDLKRMAEEAASESLKVVWDSSNTSVVESCVSAIEELGGLIGHLHLADNDCKTWTKQPVGMGNIDFRNIMKALMKIKFRGWSMIELWYGFDRIDEVISSSKNKLESIGWKA